MSRNKWTDDKLFFRLLNNKSKKTYWDNINELRNRPTKEIFKKSVSMTNSENPKEREIGIHVLAQLGTSPRPFYEETIKLYFNLLETEKEPEVLMSLLYAIGHNNDKLNKLQIDKLCSYKDTANDLIKEGLVNSLLGIDSIVAIETLIILSTDKLSHIRNWATFGIGSLTISNNKEIRKALWNRINDKHQETKLEAIVGLALRKDINVIDIIKRELLGGEYGKLLFDAIIELGEKDLLPLLKDHYKSEKNKGNIDTEWLKDLNQCINELEKR